MTVSAHERQADGNAPGTGAHVQYAFFPVLLFLQDQLHQCLRVLPWYQHMFIYKELKSHELLSPGQVLERGPACPGFYEPHKFPAFSLCLLILPQPPGLQGQKRGQIQMKYLQKQVPGIQLRIRHPGLIQFLNTLPQQLLHGHVLLLLHCHCLFHFRHHSSCFSAIPENSHPDKPASQTLSPLPR